MRFFKAFDLEDYLWYLNDLSRKYMLEIIRNERLNMRPERLLRKTNAGRPPGTHDTVIGRNPLELRRFDFQRKTRNAA